MVTDDTPMPGPSGPIRRIVIAGNGVEGWLAAGMLARRLDGEQVEILVCPVREADQWDALYAILPVHPEDVVRQMHVSDLDLIKNCDATFSLGACIEGLGYQDENRFKPYGPSGIDFQGIDFHHYWLCSGAEPESTDYFRFAPGRRAMQQACFAPPVPRNAIGSLQHEIARHVDPWLLRKRLRNAAYELGATQHRSRLLRVERSIGDDGQNQIAALITDSGERLEADLFIDATGPLRQLIGTMPGFEWQRAPLAPDYDLTIDQHRREGLLPPWHTLTASGQGWQLLIPGYAEQVSLTLTRRNSASETVADSPVFVSGHATEPWTANVLAIGHAATCLAPLEPLQALFLMHSLERMVKLLPGRDVSSKELREYNQLANRDMQEAHDLIAVHELARQFKTLLPQDLPDDALSESLARRLQLFARRGWIIPSDSGLIPPHAWASAFLFHGLIPQHYSLLAERVPHDELNHHLQQLDQRIATVVSEFPPYDDYLKNARQHPPSRPTT